MKTKTKAAPEKKFKHVMVYLGVRLVGVGFDRKRAFVWHRLENKTTELDDEEDRGLFKKNLQKRATPGAVFTMEGDEEGKNIYINSGTYEGSYANAATVAKWWALHRAAEEEWDTMSKASTQLRRRLDLERLTPIRLAYTRANPTQRGLIIANVVKFITGGVL